MCRPSSLQHLCFHPPGSTFWSRSRLLPITHAQLITSRPFNLSVGQSCLHFISPLISNYSHQYPKSHNLGFHQHPLHDTKIKPSQLALNSSPPYNQTISSSQNTMFIIDNTHFQIIQFPSPKIYPYIVHHILYSKQCNNSHKINSSPLISNHIILEQSTIKGNKLRLHSLVNTVFVFLTSFLHKLRFSSFSQLSVLFRK